MSQPELKLPRKIPDWLFWTLMGIGGGLVGGSLGYLGHQYLESPAVKQIRVDWVTDAEGNFTHEVHEVE